MTTQNLYQAPQAELTDGAARPSWWNILGRWLCVLLALTAGLPLGFCSNLYVFAWRASVFLGHWPYYGHPDPKDLPKSFYPPEALEIIIPVLVAISVAALISWLLFRFKGGMAWRLVFAVMIAIACWGGSIGFLFADPFGVLEWAMD